MKNTLLALMLACGTALVAGCDPALDTNSPTLSANADLVSRGTKPEEFITQDLIDRNGGSYVVDVDGVGPVEVQEVGYDGDEEHRGECRVHVDAVIEGAYELAAETPPGKVASKWLQVWYYTTCPWDQDSWCCGPPLDGGCYLKISLTAPT